MVAEAHSAWSVIENRKGNLTKRKNSWKKLASSHVRLPLPWACRSFCPILLLSRLNSRQKTCQSRGERYLHSLHELRSAHIPVYGALHRIAVCGVIDKLQSVWPKCTKSHKWRIKFSCLSLMTHTSCCGRKIGGCNNKVHITSSCSIQHWRKRSTF